MAPGIVRFENSVEGHHQLGNAQRPRAAGGVRFQEPIEIDVPAPVGAPVQLARPVLGEAAAAAAAREDVMRQFLLNHRAERNGEDQPAAIGQPEVPGRNRAAIAAARPNVAGVQPRGNSGVDNQDDIVSKIVYSSLAKIQEP